jgi:hypothetical protein
MEIDIFRVILDWKIVLITIIVIITLPIIFYFASLNKTPIKIKKVKIASSSAPPADKEGEQPQTKDQEVKKQTTITRKSRLRAKEDKEVNESKSFKESKEGK